MHGAGTGTVHRIVPGLRNEKMDIGVEQVRRYRLRGHHLDRKLPPKDLLAAAGACGVQNSPPGAWEAALFNRLEDCCLRDLRWALEEEKDAAAGVELPGCPGGVSHGGKRRFSHASCSTPR